MDRWSTRSSTPPRSRVVRSSSRDARASPEGPGTARRQRSAPRVAATSVAHSGHSPPDRVGQFAPRRASPTVRQLARGSEHGLVRVRAARFGCGLATVRSLKLVKHPGRSRCWSSDAGQIGTLASGRRPPGSAACPVAVTNELSDESAPSQHHAPIDPSTNGRRS